jgi:DNA-binding NarL/FixJ family response regulator
VVGPKATQRDPRSELSPREREVLQLLAEGMTSKEIAGKLDLAVSTIETHRKQIMAKLELRSVAELTKFAIRTGITTLE